MPYSIPIGLALSDYSSDGRAEVTTRAPFVTLCRFQYRHEVPYRHTYRAVMSYMFMLMTSSDPKTVTVTALKMQDTPTMAAWTLGIPQIRKTLREDRNIATTASGVR